MDAQALLNDFLSSEHGTQAMNALAAQGITGDQAQQVLTSAVGAAHAHIESQAGMLGTSPGKSFFAALATGLVKGDGVWGSIKDGLEGVLGGKITETIAAEVGIDPATASTIGAALTPIVTSFVKSKLN